jgi:hypothetical protein
MMNKNISKISMTIFAILGGFLLSSCAHTEKKLDEKVAQEKPINTRTELRAETVYAIETAPGLNDEQRVKLLKLRAATQASFDQIRKDSFKLEEALVQDVLTTKKYNRSEVYSIKKRLRKLSDQHFAVLSNAIDEASKILGRETDQQHRLMVNEMVSEGHIRE